MMARSPLNADLQQQQQKVQLKDYLPAQLIHLYVNNNGLELHFTNVLL